MSTTETLIDPRAVVAEEAELGAGTTVGPFAVIGPKVRLGKGCRVSSHAVIEGNTHAGDRCSFFPFSAVGQIPQDLKYRGEDTKLRIGSGNVFRESVTVNLGTSGGGGVTRIGDGNLFMAGAHIGHDSVIGSEVILANAATLAGHVDVEDGVTVGAFSGVHQFCRVGREAFVGGYSVVTRDALPYCLTVGNRAECHGPNLVGLRRRGASEETVLGLKRAYRTIFRSKRPRMETLQAIEKASSGIPEVAYLCRFIRESKRGVIG